MAECLELLTWNLLPLTIVVSNPASDFGFLSCEEAIKLAYGISVVVLWCRLVPKQKKYIYMFCLKIVSRNLSISPHRQLLGNAHLNFNKI